MNLLNAAALAVLVAVALVVGYLCWKRSTPPAYAKNVPVGPLVHDSLPAGLINRISAFESIFAEFYPRTHSEWLDGFMRDHNPEREVAIWENIARALVAYTEVRDLSPEVRKEVFVLLLARSQTSDLEHVKKQIRHLSEGAANEVIAAYGAPPQPIVTQKSSGA